MEADWWLFGTFGTTLELEHFELEHSNSWMYLEQSSTLLRGSVEYLFVIYGSNVAGRLEPTRLSGGTVGGQSVSLGQSGVVVPPTA